jgi:hypothetical protein
MGCVKYRPHFNSPQSVRGNRTFSLRPYPGTQPPFGRYAACGITGDPNPSEADTRLTRRITEASRILQIQLLDHVIIGQPMNGRQGYFSFKESGALG